MMPAAQAVEVLSQEYGKLVFHTIYGLTGDWEESQDLTQDTFHQALRSIDAARKTSGEQFHAKAWLLSIALNTVRMQRRRRTIFRFIPFSHMHDGKQAETESETLSAQAAPVQPVGYGATETDDPAELIAEQDAVRRTMAKLAEPFRVCLLLSIVGGLPISEIADLLDMKEAAVRQRLARARRGAVGDCLLPRPPGKRHALGPFVRPGGRGHPDHGCRAHRNHGSGHLQALRGPEDRRHGRE